MTRTRPSPAAPLRIGTRGSPLALAQAHETRDRLMQAHDLPIEAFEISVIQTTGDRVQDRALREIGGKGLFTREIEQELLLSGIDIAVHSMKDMPVLQPQGLILDCYLPREDARDAFVSFQPGGIAAVPVGARIGTSSLRRGAQMRLRRPDVEIVEFRGNVQTRLRKLNAGVAHGTFLAMAGLIRLGRTDVPAVGLAVEEMLPAVAQGAIGIERRADDSRMAALLEPIHDRATAEQLAAERAFLATLDGSCETPIAGLADVTGGVLRLRGQILRPDGSEVLEDAASAPVADGAALGEDMARRLLARAGSGFFDWR
ncbi:hydroxymethylbilane synthase [Pseudooceanicola sp.]|uniref:hydroxymethylbilane synthase n=1 Tax=Pseudooceanicola sp. TaxID=1914328 RepID=UPI00262ED88E|nr:hydroxymethylbilane synthase [Pseudooceanicola sp.]MDF1855249.1 hydroxymethylbilane synthase [Pseudooceanicola sp.]